MTSAPDSETATQAVSTDLIQVCHVTRYRYRRPVKFGPHRAILRPHESNDLRLIGIDFETHPESSRHWVHDVFSNSRTVFEFAEPSDTLEIKAVFQVVRSTVHQPTFPIAPHAQTYPFDYFDEQQIDLTPTMQPGYDDPAGAVKAWAEGFAAKAKGDTWALLTGMNSAIHGALDYQRREEPGVQPPDETLSLGAGSCRDFAVLMMEGVRRLGFAARFVTGYLYDPHLDDKDAVGLSGAGATHAWVQIFLPGAGWIEFDPTNGLVASGHLIRTGVARTAAQAAPLTGSFEGAEDDFLGMDVEVEVTALAPTLHS